MHTKKIKIHPTLNHLEDIQTICKPLEALGITYFAHAKVTDKQFTAISNNPGFIEHYLLNHYYNVDIHTANTKSLPGSYILWDSITPYGLSEKMHIAAAQFGVLHTFSIIETDAKGYQFFHFATNNPSAAINQRYLSHLDFLKRFVLYFKERMKSAKNLLKAYDIIFTFDKKIAGFSFNEEDYQLVIPELSLKKFAFANCANPLTKREIEVLKELHAGKNISQIASSIHVAEVTVNKYIAIIKEKTNCHTQFQLGEFFARMIDNDGEASYV